MAGEIKPLDQLLKELPPESEAELRDFCRVPHQEAATKVKWTFAPELGGCIGGLPRTVYVARTSEEVVGLAR